MRRPVRSIATDRVGDVVGVGAAIVGTIAIHLAIFGGDQYFPLRFLLSPVDNPVAFGAFWISLVLLVVAVVRAGRAGAWSVLTPSSAQRVKQSNLHPETQTDARSAASAGEQPAAPSGTQPGAQSVSSPDTPASAHVPTLRFDIATGAVTRRALRVAAVIAALNALFMIVFPIAIIVVFAVIFAIAAALIGGVYIVLRAVAPEHTRVVRPGSAPAARPGAGQSAPPGEGQSGPPGEGQSGPPGDGRGHESGNENRSDRG
ncbi:hypothetical protein SAMN04489807_1498 [Microbacterium hydrocarbonoxydans]|uniref:Uncharacterized protein n=1 Tax=Microbacterium hydrocarbonoxydans TaxID=273678 RepID=A0A1H4KPM8_9MICO|nr:hypothetical protein SAMN04489807_1498 [Microbacterium hydrocarbonoxydans]